MNVYLNISKTKLLFYFEELLIYEIVHIIWINYVIIVKE